MERNVERKREMLRVESVSFYERICTKKKKKKEVLELIEIRRRSQPPYL